MPFRKGSRHKPESIARIVASTKGRVFSAESRAKMSKAANGRHHTPETRAKISATLTGNATKSPEMRQRISAAMKNLRLDGECVYCFGPAQAHDHVIPRGRPGWDDPDNIVLACVSCNASKGARTPEEWLALAS